MTRIESALLELLQLSLGNKVREPLAAVLSADEWKKLIHSSFRLRVPSIAIDGYGALGIGTTLDDEECDKLRFTWFDAALRTEEDNRRKMRAAARFADALGDKGIGCLVLKGMAFATYYSDPAHRECGDCDVYLGDGFEAGNALGVEIGARFEFGTYKHSHLQFGHLLIENHRYLTDFCGTRQGIRIERLMQKVISEEPGRPIGNTRLLCPCDRFNALFLLWHAQMDFMMGGLYLKEIYDWAALLGRCRETIDWEGLYADLAECRLLEFAKLMNSLCVAFLGVDQEHPAIRPCKDEAVVKEVIADVLADGLHTRGQESFTEKCLRILRRFGRMWRYRRFSTEGYLRMVWNCLTINSYLSRKIELRALRPSGRFARD